MLRLRIPFVLGLTLIALALPAAAAPRVFTLDPQATQITFGFGATLHTVEGSLRASLGEIRFDLDSGEATGEIVLDMTSATTQNSRRDRKMHEKILESGTYPRAVYRVERISGTFQPGAASDLLLRGKLEIHGATHPLDLPASVHVEGDRVTATGRARIPYVEWGLSDPSFFILRVEKQVEVQVRAVGRVSPAP